jgi:hypothetical protein
MGLIKDSIKYARRASGLTSLVVLTLVDVVMRLATSYLLAKIADEKDISYVKFIVFIKLLNPFVGYVLDKKRISMSMEMKSLFQSDAFKKYDAASYRDKNTKPQLQISLFNKTVESARITIWMMMDWGVSSVSNISATAGGCLVAFYTMGLIKEICVLMIVYGLVYYFIIRKKQVVFTKMRKELSKQCLNLRARIELLLPSFQYKEVTTDYIMKLNDNINEKDKARDVAWCNISSIIEGLNEYSTALMYLASNGDIARVMLVGTSMGSFSSSITQSTGFFNNYNRMCSDYEIYTDCWKNVKFK